jgi:hypothetical protein
MRTRLLFLILVVVLATANLWGQQGSGQINGTVTDSSGAVVHGAKVTVSNPDTAFSRSTETGDTGGYSLTLLPPGTYNVRYEAPNFATVEQKAVSVAVGQAVTLNITLKPGATHEVVEVTGEAPLINTTNSEIGGSVSPLEVKDLPIVDRNFSGLMTLIPGVRPAESFDPTKSRTGNVTVNGSDGRAVETSVDGGDDKDLVVGGMIQNFTMEGIQEFNVLTNRYSAESGHSVGAVVNVVTKSGTNTFHGSAFGLFQLSATNRENFFEKASGGKKGFHRYQYGGSIGGPIIKDKLFFFGAVENKREPGGLTVNANSFQELTTFRSQTTGFPGGPYAFPVTTLPFPYIDWLVTAKMDWHVSDRQSVFFRYGREKWTNPNDQVGTPAVPFSVDGTQGNSTTNQFHDFVISHTYVFSPTKVNNFNAHFQDFVNAILAAPTNTFTYPTAGGGVTTNPNINFSDGSQVGQNVNVPQETLIRKYQFRDDFSWVHNRHTLKMGVNWTYFAKMGGFFFFGANGYQAFFFDDPLCIQTGGPCASGASYPAGISTPGAVQEITFSGGSGATVNPPWHSLGLYLQDDFRVTPRLTLNMGLRWDGNLGFLTPQLTNSFSTTNRTINVLEQVLAANPSAPRDAAGMARIQQIVGNAGALRRTTTSFKEFQPRVGFAWDVTGSGKHVLRGGYGIARDQIFQNITLFATQQEQPTIYGTIFDFVADNPPGLGCTPTAPFNICNFRFGIDPFPVPSTPPTDIAPGGVGRILAPNITDPWSQQFSLGWSWQVNPDYAFSVDYYHVLGTWEERVLNENPVIGPVCDPAFGGNPANIQCVNGTGTRLLDAVFLDTPAIGAPGRLAQVYQYSTNNRSLYDGLNFQLRKRMSNHVMFQASYVLSWSRAWGGFPVAGYGGSGLAVTPEQQFQPNEFNRTNFDERSRFVFSGVFQLPHGFQIMPVFQASSGRPYSFLAGSDIDGDGRIIIDRVCVGSTLLAPITTPGCVQVKPNTLNGRPFVQMDLRSSKDFNLTERLKLSLYFEVYNLFNRSNFCNSFEQSVSAGLVSAGGTFDTPRSFCGGPSNAPFGGISGFSSAAVPSLHTQYGLRFEF